MSSVRQVTDRFDELKQNGFEDRQARVLAIAIDETVEDRHAGFLAHIDKRFDDVDKHRQASTTSTSDSTKSTSDSTTLIRSLLKLRRILQNDSIGSSTKSQL